MKEKVLINALESILAVAMDHPAFDHQAFDDHDYESLTESGGDICDWTMLAITASDALQEIKKLNAEAHASAILGRTRNEQIGKEK
jgi:hypothetical protein